MNVATARSVADGHRPTHHARARRQGLRSPQVPATVMISSVVIEVEDGETKPRERPLLFTHCVEARDIAILVQKRGHVDNVTALARRA